VLPYSKSLLVLECTGAALKSALENGLYPQVSQLKVVFDKDKHLVEAFLNGEPLDDERRYRVASNDFCGRGKDGYGFEPDMIVAHSLALDIELLEEYLVSLPQPLDVRVDGRLSYR